MICTVSQGYGDDAADLRAGASGGHAVVGAGCAADQFKAELVDVVGHGEALNGLGAFIGTGDAVRRVCGERQSAATDAA